MNTMVEERPVAATLQPQLSTVRHISMFDPARFDRTRVDVVGCGSVGARIAMEVAKLGTRNLHLWDFDNVESHNIANQPFVLADIGRPKVEALAEQILSATGLKVTIHKQRVEGGVALGKVVFIAVDSMAARKSIFADSLRMKITTDVVIEIRMGVEEFRIYGFSPRSLREIKAWEAASQYDDKPVVPNACQMQTTIGATAGITACIAVHRFLQWYRREFVRDPAYTQPPHFEQIVMLRPLTVITKGV